MSGTIAAFHKAMATVWAAQLNTKFTAYWASADRTSFTSLNDGEAAPGTPFPYCVFQIAEGKIEARMSGSVVGANQLLQTVPVTFQIQAGSTDTVSAKTVALTLADEVLKVFGGYPDAAETPEMLTMDSGAHVITQYLTDYGMRTGDTNYLWTIEYLFLLDMPVAV